MTGMSRTQRYLFYAIITAALLTRVLLAYSNREANDDHMQVVHLILQNGSLPVKADCWECFQPKLFHFSMALLVGFLGISNPEHQIVLIQFVNMLLGLELLWVVWAMLQELEIGDMNGRILAFGLVALNPNLLTTSIQVTNDTFVIVFSSLAIYFAYHFIQRRRTPDFVLMSLYAVMAASSKTNGALVIAGIAGFLVLRSIFTRNIEPMGTSHFSLRWAGGDLLPACLFGLVSLVLMLLNPLNQYYQNMQLYGQPVTLNTSTADFPQLVTPTETLRPGIVSIADGFATFKLPSLLVEPQITNDNKHYPAHRTSFWTILYGRSNFIQYDPWPKSWIDTSKAVRNLGRVLYGLALLPTAALLIGFAVALRGLLARPAPGFSKVTAGFFLLLLAAFLGFAVLYALGYRIYTVIKTIFIFPAILSMAYLYVLGFDWIRRASQVKFAWFHWLYQAGGVCLLAAYFLDVAVLVVQLGSVYVVSFAKM